ncbi:MAG: hypothetical protein BA862_00070 [Desulfobulbaceae bacterium S3730MH12]|nr:MAG: hypothetical protein BA862_00070 [Desulfobulbaceae bacterium S3730MH12]OEU80618.1 MAG: hypothetical protein BA873_16300 [Desulfobulbaceae bacterium C00003063]
MSRADLIDTGDKRKKFKMEKVSNFPFLNRNEGTLRFYDALSISTIISLSLITVSFSIDSHAAGTLADNKLLMMQ